MKIWVDADACPKVIKEILFRAADRTKTPVTLVANKLCRLPGSAFVSFIQVEHGADVADDEIANRCEAGDLVITADIPLAARAVEKGARALDPRGTLYDKDNIKQVLTMRNFMQDLRGSGIETGGPDSFSQREREMFANELEKVILAASKKTSGDV
jgi:uncharacterized protein YaiI (UPF0178 family)